MNTTALASPSAGSPAIDAKTVARFAARSFAAALAISSLPLAAQVLVPLTPTQITQTTALFQGIWAAVNPGAPVPCVYVADYDATLPGGPAVISRFNPANPGSCPFTLAGIQSQVLAAAQAQSPAIRAGTFLVAMDPSNGNTFVLAYPGSLVPACCLVPFAIGLNSGTLQATGNTAIGSAVSLAMSDAQSANATAFAFLALRPANVQLPEGTVLVDAASTVGPFPLTGAPTPTTTLAIPNAPSLIGLDLYAQGLFFDPAATPTARFTNGLILTIT